jgi:hypothetical protein
MLNSAVDKAGVNFIKTSQEIALGLRKRGNAGDIMGVKKRRIIGISCDELLEARGGFKRISRF